MRQSSLPTATLVLLAAVSVGACITPPREGPVSNSNESDASMVPVEPDTGIRQAIDAPVEDTRSTPDRGDGDGDAGGPRPDGPENGEFRSCQNLYDSGERDNGVYTTRLADDESIDIFCEMTIDGGGWTLVGRSAEGASGEMGWTVDYGEPDDPNRHYSLAAKTHGVVAKEFLVTDLEEWDETSGLAPGTRQHRGWLPDNLFESGCAQAVCATTGVTYLAGDCEPAEHARMFDFSGFTNNRERFFFRDSQPFDEYGLQPRGWISSEDCDFGGGLHGRQGLLFVR